MPNCVWETLFKVNEDGRAGLAEGLVPIANLETLEMSIDNTVVDWYSIGGEGFANNLVTAKKIMFNGTAKRTPDDPGNDYIAGLMLAVGTAAQSAFEITFPDGDKLAGNVNISVTGRLGGAPDVEPLNFEIHVDGKPTYTAAT